MGLDNNDDTTPLPRIDQVRGMRRIRFWAIKRLARGDVILLNSIMAIPPPWVIAKTDLDAGALVGHNMFVRGDYEFVPGTRIMSTARIGEWGT